MHALHWSLFFHAALLLTANGQCHQEFVKCPCTARLRQAAKRNATCCSRCSQRACARRFKLFFFPPLDGTIRAKMNSANPFIARVETNGRARADRQTDSGLQQITALAAQAGRGAIHFKSRINLSVAESLASKYSRQPIYGRVVRFPINTVDL